MPFLQEYPSTRGIRLPPSGWVLAVLLAVYVLTGLVGHDPWRHEDAISIGVAYDIFRNGNWLTPELAGRPHADAPLYYWTSALTAQALAWLLPVHDAARVASGIFTLLALFFILRAARELHGREYSAAAPLTLAGSIGFLFHAHEAQPMLAALTAQTAAYWALALFPRRPRTGAAVFGAAVGLAFLANGLLPTLTLLAVVVLCLLFVADFRKNARHLVLSAAIALLLAGSWLLPLYSAAPAYAAAFFENELAVLARGVPSPVNLLKYLNLLLWYAWPALPLAAWAVWAKRRALATLPLALPAISFFAVLLILGLSIGNRSAFALLLLPPLVLLAVPGLGSLRRGAASAFDWFGMMAFTFFAAVAWIGWSALVFGWPERLARQAVRLHPGFTGQFEPAAVAFAVLATFVWFWLIFTSPRSPFRSITHWMAGLTLFWLLIVSLWMQWIDYGKSYRAVSAALVAALPAKIDCVTNANLPVSVLASLDYFDGIRTVPQKDDAAAGCSWLLAEGDIRKFADIRAAGWRVVWEGHRPSDRSASEKIHLFRRMSSGKAASALPEFEVEGGEFGTYQR